jgi:plastocyanin domain-containing protein
MAWVTNDGEYNGSSVVLEFDFNALNDQQWSNLEDMSSMDRLDYVEAILAEDDDKVRHIELDNFTEEWGL